jgi:hypothetical protein
VGPGGLEPGDATVELGELAAVDGDGAGAHVARGVAGPQALHEGPGVVEREPDREERPDLGDDPFVVAAVVAVTVGGPTRRQQALGLVVAQRTGRRAGPLGELSDPHPHLLDSDRRP